MEARRLVRKIALNPLGNSGGVHMKMCLALPLCRIGAVIFENIESGQLFLRPHGGSMKPAEMAVPERERALTNTMNTILPLLLLVLNSCASLMAKNGCSLSPIPNGTMTRHGTVSRKCRRRSLVVVLYRIVRHLWDADSKARWDS